MFMKRMSRVALVPATAFAIFAALSFGASAIGLSQLSSPPSNEPLAQPMAPNPRPLFEPVAQATELEIAGQIYLIPAGATALEFISGPPAVNAATGKAAGPVHKVYWLVARGQSTAKIDSTTGEVFDWGVTPADRVDFERLLSPRPAR
jgi:hypothetical protein